MARTEKIMKIDSFTVRGRKVKGPEPSRYITLDQEFCQRWNIQPGDELEVQIRTITKEETTARNADIPN